MNRSPPWPRWTPQLAKMTELRFFGGLNTTETARILDVSKRTVERGWNTTRAWLRSRLQPGSQAH
ncbi:MAG: ECF-type sigma factor [Planctomycetota bacterium]